MTNKDVVIAWVNQNEAHTAHLESRKCTDGTFRLQSYGTLIACIYEGIAYITTTKYSQTTSTHTNMATRTAKSNGYEIKPLCELPEHIYFYERKYCHE